MVSIPVITEADPSDGGSKVFGKRGTEPLVLSKIDPAVLRESLAKLVDGLQEMARVEDRENSFRLKQVSAAVEISAEGGISLIGTMKAGGKAAITLTFER